MTARVRFLSFGCVRPDLDALACERSAVAGAADGARHPEAAAADLVYDRRALALVVGSAGIEGVGCKALRTGGQHKRGNPGCCHHGAASNEEPAAVEHDGRHGSTSLGSVPLAYATTSVTIGAKYNAFAAICHVEGGQESVWIGAGSCRGTNDARLG